MKENDYNIDQMEAWIRNEMDSQARAEFQAKIENDPDLWSAVESHRTLIESIEIHGADRLKSKIHQTVKALDKLNFFEQNQKEIKMTQINKKSGMRWVSIAASLLLVGVAAMFYLNSDTPSAQQMSPGEVFAEHYQPDSKIVSDELDRLEAPGFADPDNSDSEDTLVLALKNYQNYKYNEARTLLSKYLVVNPENQTARFYMGLTQLQISNYATAIDYLLPLCTEEGFPHQDASKWYLAMSYTQLDGPDGMVLAKKYLKALSIDNSSEYQGNAKAYMDALNL